MERGKETKRALKKQLIISLTLIMALVIVTVSASYSWFVYQNPNQRHEIEVSVMDTFNLTLKSGEHGDDKITTNLHPAFYLKPVCGDGKNFFVPHFGNVASEEYPGEFVIAPTGEYDVLTDDDAFDRIFKIDFTMSVDGFVDLYLEHTDYENTRTFVSMAEGYEIRKSAYGDFSKDNINGAVRVAILQNDEVKCVWIPNSDVQLKKGNPYTLVSGESAEIEDKYTFLTDYDVESKTSTEQEIMTGAVKNGSCIIDGVVYIWGDVTDDNCPPITTMIGEQKFSIVMWIDGTDRECDNALVGGKVQLNLCFTAKDHFNIEGR